MTAVTVLLCAIEDFAAVFGLLSVLLFLLQKQLRLTKLRVAITALLLLLPAVLLLYFPSLPEPYDALPDLLANILYIIAALILIKEPKLLPLIGVTVFYTFTVEVFWGLLAYYTTQALWLEYTVCTVLYLLSGVCVWLAASRAGTDTLHRCLSAVPKWSYAVLIFFEIMCYYKAYGEREERFDALFLLASVALILTFLFLLLRIMRQAREEQTLLQQMTLQKEFAETAITDDEELRRFRHDYKNHMMVVQTLLESGRIDEARQYLAAMQEPVRDALQKIRTGNFVADTILNHKAQTAAEAQATLRFVGKIPADGIRSEDVCTIFSNLLDNAVEACRAAGGERSIFVEAKTAQGSFLLSISNPTQNLKDGSHGTNKPDRRNHGFGLKNVERAVKKYNGTLQTSVSDGVFSADVLLKLPKAAQTTE